MDIRDKRIFDVRAYGAVGDGITLDTEAINRAVDDCALNGGGVVLFSHGIYLSGSIRMKDNVVLRIDKNAAILGAPNDINAYDLPEENPWSMYQDFGHSHFRNALIWGENLTNIGIVGEGTIFGGGLSRSDSAPGGGDKAISLRECSEVTLKDFRIVQGGHIAVLANGCRSLSIANLTIRTSRDGLNIINCRDVEVRGCDIESIRYENGEKSGGDDAIALKSDYALGRRITSENIQVYDCVVATNCFGIHFGSETVGDFRNITFKNIRIKSADKAGIGITSSDGSNIDGITYENISMEAVGTPIFVKLSNRKGRTPEHEVRLGSIKNIKFTKIKVRDVQGYISTNRIGIPHRWAAAIIGKPSHPVENIVLENVDIVYKGGGAAEDADIVVQENDSHQPRDLGTRPAYGLYCRHVSNIQLKKFKVQFEEIDRRPAIVFDYVDGALFDSISCMRGGDSDVVLRSVTDFKLVNSEDLVVKRL